jgi:hypothetical protein
MKRWTLYSLDYGASQLKGIVSQSIDPGILAKVLSDDGQVDPTYAYVAQAAPMVSFSTRAVAAALAVCGISGLAVTSPPAILYFQQLDDLGTRESGSVHLTGTVNRGLLVPRTLRAAQGEEAVLSFDLFCLYNGTLLPIVWAASAALAGDVGSAEAFTVGPVSINGAALDNVQEITVDFGIQVRTGSKDGEAYPRDASILVRRPTITVRTTDLSVLQSLDVAGAKQGATDSVVYFRKLDRLGTRVADATAEHVKIAIDDGLIVPQAGSAAGEDVAGGGIVIHPAYDGAAAILAVSTASAIA